MKLLRLTIGRMPGIEDPFGLEPFPRLNLILGPNGSGKTTFCRAIRALLWPQLDNPSPLSLQSQWAQDQQILHAERFEGTSTRWHRDGSDCDPPQLPQGHLARCYELGILDLLKHQAGETERELAQRIRIQMAGGYDLDAVHEALFAIKARWGLAESKDVLTMRRHLAGLQRQRRELGEREEELPGKREQLIRTRLARSELDRLRQAANLVRLRDELEQAQADLAAFPGPMAQLKGDEKERLVDLEQDIAGTERELQGCRHNLDAAEKDLAAAALPDQSVSSMLLDTWRGRLRDVTDLERDLRQARQDEAAARAALAETRAALADGWDSETAPPIPVDAVRDVEDHLRRLVGVTWRRDNLQRLCDHEQLRGAPPVARASSLSEGSCWLEDWLEAGAGSARPWLLLAALLPVLAGLEGLWQLLTGQPLGWIPLIAGLGSAALLWWLAWDRIQARVTCERGFRSTGLVAPLRWRPEEVRERLAELRAELARAEAQRVLQGIRGHFTAELSQLDERVALLARERAVLRRRFGMAPRVAAGERVSETDLLEFVRRVHEYQKAASAWHQAHARASQLSGDRDQKLQDANHALATQGYPTAPDAATAFAHLDDLDSRNRQANSAQAVIQREQGQRDALQAELEKRRQQRRDLLVRLGLAEQDGPASVSQLLERWPQYQAAVRKHDHLQRDIQARQANLEDDPELVTLSPAEIDSRIAEREDLVRHEEDLLLEIDRIENQIQAARASADFQLAQAELARARAALVDKRDDLLHRTAGQFLLQQARREHEMTGQLPVLQRAQELFGAFTHGRYRLLVSLAPDDQPGFSALDSMNQKGLTLTELSDGTRAQLLLAIRVAFITEAERGARPPLLLDESLTSSDPERFDAIAGSLLELMQRDDRQLFYLTANPSDVRAWQRAAVRMGQDAIEPIDLEVARRLPQRARLAELQLASPVPLPDPAGLTATQYGNALAVARFDPRKRPEATPLFYLLRDDLQLLHRLLRSGIETAGQWLALAPALAERSEVTSQEAAHLAARVVLLRSFVEAWRRGRGRPLDRQVLHASGAVSNSFIDQVSALAAEFGGDGERLLQALQEGLVSRFHRKNIQELEDYLEAETIIDRQPILALADIKEQVLLDVQEQLRQEALAPGEVAQLVQDLWQAAGHSPPDSDDTPTGGPATGALA